MPYWIPKKLIKLPASHLLIYSLFVSSAHAISDAEIVQGLEALGDLEAAYPLAVQLAEQQNNYQRWRDLAQKYQQYDTDNQAYLSAWQAVKQLNLANAYRDFLTLRSQSPLNAQAIHAMFQLSRELDTIHGYMRFMEEFPNTLEAVQALLRIHEIAFQRATEKHQPEVYDAFVQTFIGAKQIPQAIEQAFQSERDSLIAADEQTDDSGHERLARRLFNQAREAKENGDGLVMTRKYRLLDLDRFKDTKVYSELLDRKERLEYQTQQKQQQAQILTSLNQLGQSVVQELQAQGNNTRHLIQAQGQAIHQAIENQGQNITHILQKQGRLITDMVQTQGEILNESIQHQGRDMVQAIETHSDQLTGLLDSYNDTMTAQLAQTNQRLDQNVEAVYQHIDTQMGGISDAIYDHTQRMREAANRAMQQNAEIFRRNKEAQAEAQHKSLVCAEELGTRIK